MGTGARRRFGYPATRQPEWQIATGMSGVPHGDLVSILHVDTDPSWRGGQQLVCRLAAGLSNAGVPTTVACPPHGRLYAELSARNVELIAIPAGASLRSIRILRAAAPHLLVAHTSHAHGLSVMSGLPVVVHRWVDAPVSATPWSRWKYRQPLAYVACSTAVASVLRHGGVAPERIQVVYGGTDPLDCTPSVDAPEVLAVGARVHHKGHDVLARAVGILRMRGVRVDVGVAGTGPLQPAGLRFLGPRDDIGGLLQGARIFVHPSRSEGLGMAVVEAMMAGVPVVASNVGGIPEIVGQDGVLVEPDRPVDLADALERVLEGHHPDPEGARARVQRQFSTDQMVDGAHRVYAKVIADLGMK